MSTGLESLKFFLGGRRLDTLTLRPRLLSLCLCLTALLSCPLAPSLVLETGSVAYEEKPAAVDCPHIYFQSAYGSGKQWLGALHPYSRSPSAVQILGGD